MRQKKKIFIHIGVGKTGTTAIQDSMMLHREEISAQGVLYPLTGIVETGHQNLVTLWTDEFSPENITAYSDLLVEFEESGKNTMFISSEKFCYANGEFVRRISQVLEGYDVKIIVYVRSQIAQIESTFLLWLRLGYSYGGSFDAFFETHLGSFDYNRIISPWAVFFGTDAIIAGAYDHPRLKTDAFSGIEDVLGIKIASGNLQVSNKSLISSVAHMLCAFDESSPDPLFREEVMEAMLSISSKFKKSSGFNLMDAEKTQRVKDFYMLPNYEFASRYLPKEDAAFFLSKI